MKVKDTMTITGAARAIGCARTTLTTQIARGKVTTVRTADGQRLVPVAEVERVRASGWLNSPLHEGQQEQEARHTRRNYFLRNSCKKC